MSATNQQYIYLTVTNSMEQGPSQEANSHSANQEIPHILWNLKVNYCVHKSLTLVSILSQINTVHNFPPCFSKMHPNIILLSI